MKKIAIMLSIILLIISLKPILPESTALYTETVKIVTLDDQYSLDLTVPVYLKKGLTYKEENRKIKINMGASKRDRRNWKIFYRSSGSCRSCYWARKNHC